MDRKAEIVKEGSFYTYSTTCPACGKPAEVRGLRKQALDRWDLGRGEFVQDAFPQLSADDREILVSGMHGECFDEEFPPDDDDPGFDMRFSFGLF